MRVFALMTMILTGMAAFAGCAPSKAVIDYSYSQAIEWPGGGLEPRVRYLWSLSRISDDGEIYRSDDGQSVYRDSAFLVRPHGIFVSPENVMYITDTDAARVSVVDLNTLESFNILGFDLINFSSPIGVVESSRGIVFISDSDLQSVGRFDKKGKFLGFLEGDFKRPTGLAIDREAERLYITDTWANKIYIYSLDGSQIGSFGESGEGPGQLNYPTHLAVGQKGNIYVSDTVNFRVQTFSREGKFIREFGLPGDKYGHFDKIKGIALDQEGHIYVVDSRLDMVQIFDRQGRLLLFWGGTGTFYGQFRLPAGIYIDETNRIFVVDSLSRRVQAFQFLGGDQIN